VDGNGLDGRPPDFETKGRDDVFSLGKSLASALPLGALLLNPLVSAMTAGDRTERAQSGPGLRQHAHRAFEIARAVLDPRSALYWPRARLGGHPPKKLHLVNLAAPGGDGPTDARAFESGKSRESGESGEFSGRELHLCVVWEPGLLASLYGVLLATPGVGSNLRAVHLHPALQAGHPEPESSSLRVKTLTAFYASSLRESGFGFGAPEFRVDDARGAQPFAVLFFDKLQEDWVGLTPIKTALREEINAMRIPGVAGFQSLHCTENPIETAENLFALGYQLGGHQLEGAPPGGAAPSEATDGGEASSPGAGLHEVIHEDARLGALVIPGPRPYFATIPAALAALEGIDFVILRNWERDVASFDADGFDDVDLLVANHATAARNLGAIPVPSSQAGNYFYYLVSAALFTVVL